MASTLGGVARTLSNWVFTFPFKNPDTKILTVIYAYWKICNVNICVPWPHVSLQAVYPATVQEYREGIRLSLLYMSSVATLVSPSSLITPGLGDCLWNKKISKKIDFKQIDQHSKHSNYSKVEKCVISRCHVCTETPEITTALLNTDLNYSGQRMYDRVSATWHLVPRQYKFSFVGAIMKLVYNSYTCNDRLKQVKSLILLHYNTTDHTTYSNILGKTNT